MIYVKEANYEDIEKEYLFIRDMPIDENGMTNEWHGISREEFEDVALKQMIAYSKGEDEIYLRLIRDNIASLKVMLHNGGYIVGEDEAKYYVRIKK